jgi:hypothetical protein
MALLQASTKIAFLATLAMLTSGCAKSTFDADLAVEKRELGEIYDSYMFYLKVNERAPTDLSQIDVQEEASTAGNRALREGKYKVAWGVNDKSAGTILAYGAEAADKGGAVLMANGTVKTMTAAQFNAAKPR